MPDNPAPPSMPPASESPEWLADAVNHEMTLWAVEHLAASQGVAVPAEAAREAIAMNTIIERIVRMSLRMRCVYALVEGIKNDVAKCEGEVISADYAERCDLLVAIVKSRVPAFIARWELAGALVIPDQPK